jgi:hypothetical protein
MARVNIDTSGSESGYGLKQVISFRFVGAGLLLRRAAKALRKRSAEE